MMNIKSMLMLSVSCLTFMVAKDASANLNYNINSRESNLDTKHIYTHAHLSTKHLSSAYFSSPMAFNLRGVSIAPSSSNLSTSNFTLTASVCFVTDTNACGGNGYTTSDSENYSDIPATAKCAELGYNKSTCDLGYSPKNFCPFDSRYFQECICSEVCSSGYQENPCSSGMLESEQINPICKTCYKCKACNDECPSGYTTFKGSCNTISSEKTECGNPCYENVNSDCSFGSTIRPSDLEGYIVKTSGSNACGQTCYARYNDTCPLDYTKTQPSCYDSQVIESGATCYKEKACCPNACSLTSCPLNNICSSEICSGKLCSVGCESPYVKSGNNCTCPSNYTLSCSDNGYAGGIGPACGGNYKSCICASGYSWNGSTCSKNCQPGDYLYEVALRRSNGNSAGILKCLDKFLTPTIAASQGYNNFYFNGGYSFNGDGNLQAFTGINISGETRYVGYLLRGVVISPGRFIEAKSTPIHPFTTDEAAALCNNKQFWLSGNYNGQFEYPTLGDLYAISVIPNKNTIVNNTYYRVEVNSAYAVDGLGAVGPRCNGVGWGETAYMTSLGGDDTVGCKDTGSGIFPGVIRCVAPFNTNVGSVGDAIKWDVLN